MDTTQSVRFFNRGPSPAVRLVFFSVLSLLLLFVDGRYRYLESTRSALSVLISPVQRLATLPGMLWRDSSDFFSAQQQLAEENDALRRQHEHDAALASQLRSLQQENGQLRKLLDLPQRAPLAAIAAEVIYTERDVFKRKLIIDKGAEDSIRVGQVVMDDAGIVGQITRVHPLLSEVTLVTEKDHAVPVQSLRNGLRTIVFGTGDTSHLSLRYMPVSSDIERGDVLVTSGIDGLYPPGIPVAQVDRVERDPAYPFARVTCLPLAGVDKHRHVMVLSLAPPLPPRPVGTESAPADPEADKRPAEPAPQESR